MSAPNVNMLAEMVRNMSREEVLRLLNDPRVSVESLRAGLAIVAGTPLTAPVATAVAPPASAPAGAAGALAAMKAAQTAAAQTAAPPAPPKAPKVPKAPKEPAAGAGAGNGTTPDAAIDACVANGLAFSAGDIATLCALDARASSIRTAIKNAEEAKKVVSAGEKRFMRYAATVEIATAASLKARGK